MPLLINLRHIERETLEIEGELSAEDLDLANLDELIQLAPPVTYELEAERLDDAILVQGRVEAVFKCECARCLKSFKLKLDLENWACHLPLEGEDAATVINDSVDLTPALREDILLQLPQRPLCKPDCAGLPKTGSGKAKKIAPKDGPAEMDSNPWAELNKLKL